MEGKKLKKNLTQCLLRLVEGKVDTAKQVLKSLEESKNNETKSSAGDKHETGRAMVQREEEQARTLLAKSLELKNTLVQMDLDKTFSKVEFGSLVVTNQGTYFMSIGVGQIRVGNVECFAISPGSPLGGALLSKTVGDEVVFQEKEYVIDQVS